MEQSFAEYFANYAKCYDDFDPERLLRCFNVPTVMVKNGSVVAISTSSDVLAYLTTLVNTYRERGLKKSS